MLLHIFGKEYHVLYHPPTTKLYSTDPPTDSALRQPHVHQYREHIQYQASAHHHHNSSSYALNHTTKVIHDGYLQSR